MSQLAAVARADDGLRTLLQALDRAWLAYRERVVAARDGEFSRAAANDIATRSEGILPFTERVVTHSERSLRALLGK